jgi:NAD(P)-dependent dehydrogenase (short-subunit alcohol dehydrogenase family)
MYRTPDGCVNHHDKRDINFRYDDYDGVPVGLWDCRAVKLCLVAEAFKKTKETFGTIDIVINNAGIVGEDRWETAIEINVVRNKNIIGKTVIIVCHYECIHDHMVGRAELSEADDRRASVSF